VAAKLVPLLIVEYPNINKIKENSNRVTFITKFSNVAPRSWELLESIDKIYKGPNAHVLLILFLTVTFNLTLNGNVTMVMVYNTTENIAEELLDLVNIV